MYVCLCIYRCTYLSMYVCMYACMHVCMYVCMHASCIYDDRLFGGAHETAMGVWEMAAGASRAQEQGARASRAQKKMISLYLGNTVARAKVIMKKNHHKSWTPQWYHWISTMHFWYFMLAWNAFHVGEMWWFFFHDNFCSSNCVTKI